MDPYRQCSYSEVLTARDEDNAVWGGGWMVGASPSSEACDWVDYDGFLCVQSQGAAQKERVCRGDWSVLVRGWTSLLPNAIIDSLFSLSSSRCFSPTCYHMQSWLNPPSGCPWWEWGGEGVRERQRQWEFAYWWLQLMPCKGVYGRGLKN